MKLITVANKAEYETWFARALVDDTVWPFMSFWPRYRPAVIEDDDWERRILMDDSGNGLCTLTFGRSGDKSVCLCIWVLACATRPVIAASLLRDAISIASRYDVELIDSACHASNAQSLLLHEKFFGKPWGIEPFGAWNGLLKKFEGRYCYRAQAAAVQACLDLKVAA